MSTGKLSLRIFLSSVYAARDVNSSSFPTTTASDWRAFVAAWKDAISLQWIEESFEFEDATSSKQERLLYQQLKSVFRASTSSSLYLVFFLSFMTRFPEKKISRLKEEPFEGFLYIKVHFDILLYHFFVCCDLIYFFRKVAGCTRFICAWFFFGRIFVYVYRTPRFDLCQNGGVFPSTELMVSVMDYHFEVTTGCCCFNVTIIKYYGFVPRCRIIRLEKEP